MSEAWEDESFRAENEGGGETVAMELEEDEDDDVLEPEELEEDKADWEESADESDDNTE